MSRWLIWMLVGYYLLTGLYLALLPQHFYLNAPGASATGPYNMHFVRDVGFAFTVSALGVAYGLYSRNRPVLVFGALWLLLHGLFHLALWVLHGLAFDQAALIDAATVSVPALILFGLCLQPSAVRPD